MRIFAQLHAHLAAICKGLPDALDAGVGRIPAAVELQRIHVQDERDGRHWPELVSGIDQADLIIADGHIRNEVLPRKIALEVLQAFCWITHGCCS